MIDIQDIGEDLEFADTQAVKAGNILSIQVGFAEYAPDLGIDLAYFLSPDFNFQNESFKAYLIETLVNQGVQVDAVTETLENLDIVLGFSIANIEKSTGLGVG